MANIHIHVGAHRTGSSAFQMFLELNAPALRAQGFDLAYPGRDGASDGRLKLWLPAPRHEADTVDWRVMKARHNLAGQTDDSRPLILSEENILGRMNMFYSGLFYPHVRDRARFLTRVLAGRQVARILMLVRPYDSLFISAHRKRSEDHLVDLFEDIRAPMAGFPGAGWPGVALALIEELQPRKLVIMPYTRPRTERDLIEALVPKLDPAGLVEPPRAVNASLSDAALFALQERYARGEAPQREVIEAARQDYADVAAERPYAAFTQTQKQSLRARYEADLEILRMLYGVTVMDPVNTL